MKLLPVAIVVVVLSLAGCASAPTSSLTGTGTFATADDLRAAFVAAGGTCGEWEQKDTVALALTSGYCNGDTTIQVFDSVAKRDRFITDQETILDATIPLLVGPNWVVNTPSAEKYAGALGGTITVGS